MKVKKMFLSLLTLTSLSSFAHSGLIQGARMNEYKGVIELDVLYNGCEKVEHTFELHVGRCTAPFPLQCSAELLHDDHGDKCDGWIEKTIEIPLKQNKLLENRFAGAKVTITFEDGSLASVRLPL